jgi:hypothetical protein
MALATIIRFGRYLLAGIVLSAWLTVSIADEAITWVSPAGQDQQAVHMYFFWSPLCPHCQNARAFLVPLAEQHEWLKLHSYNLLENQENLRIYQQFAASLGQDAQSVPGIFVCGQMLTGWHSPEITGQALLAFAQQCRSGAGAQAPPADASLQLPLLASVDMGDYSLPVFTLIIASLDAFNPCAFFVLLFLLSMLVHARSRARMLLIGGTFVLISGLAYFVFMVAWLNLFFLVGALHWITLIAALVAIAIGVMGIKDYLMFHRGVSLSIREENKSRLYARVRSLLSTDNLPALMFSTVVLAIVANSYELLCTAGFPMVYTRTLTLYQLSDAGYYLYIALYNLVYVIPLVIIVALFTVSMGARKLTVMQGRLLKLLSGTMMLELGVVLLVNPGLLNNIFTGFGLLLIALLVMMIAKWLGKSQAEPS